MDGCSSNTGQGEDGAQLRVRQSDPNNLCERALKKAILTRKNAMFYKTSNGAIVGDLFMSLIHTCELNGVNSFRYQTELRRHSSDGKPTRADWMPWNYGETLARMNSQAAA